MLRKLPGHLVQSDYSSLQEFPLDLELTNLAEDADGYHVENSV